MRLLCIVAECDTNCASGCKAKGAGNCDSLCDKYFRLDSTDYKCKRNDSHFVYFVFAAFSMLMITRSALLIILML